MKHLTMFAAVLLAALPLGQVARAFPEMPINYDVAKDGPIPPELAHPGRIFVTNGNSDIARFSYTFTGDSARAYTEFYKALASQGGYELVGQPDEADLVLVVSTSTRPMFGYNGGDASASQPCLRILVIDRRTAIPIWTMIQPIDFAVFHKNRDKAFERAMHRLVGEFEAFTNRAPQTAPQAATQTAQQAAGKTGA